MTPAKIIINHRTQGKGVEAVHLSGIARGMIDCGHKVMIVSPPGVNVSSEEGKKGILKTIAGNAPQLFFECFELIHNVFAIRKLIKIKKEFGCDVLYDRYAFLGIACAVASHLWKIPLVVEVNYTRKSDLSVRKRTKILSPLTRILEYIVFHKSSLLLPVSTKLSDELVERGYSKNKILISPNAVDLAAFSKYPTDVVRSRLFKSKPAVVVGFVGSYAPWHKVDMLIDSCHTIASSVNNKLALLLVGEGGIRSEIERKVAGLPQNMETVFTGFVPHNKLPEYISAMDIAVMPHSNDYGSPMKVFEYMAMGKPVIAPDLGPLRDAIDHGKEGLLFSPGKENELSAALLQLISDTEIRLKMGLLARKRVENDHNWMNRCSKILESLSLQDKEII